MQAQLLKMIIKLAEYQLLFYAKQLMEILPIRFRVRLYQVKYFVKGSITEKIYVYVIYYDCSVSFEDAFNYVKL